MIGGDQVRIDVRGHRDKRPTQPPKICYQRTTCVVVWSSAHAGRDCHPSVAAVATLPSWPASPADVFVPQHRSHERTSSSTSEPNLRPPRWYFRTPLLSIPMSAVAQEPALSMRVPLKYVCEDTDRQGNVRCYVLAPGKHKVRIRALLGTPEFRDEYQAAIASAAETPATAGRRGKEGIVSLSLRPVLCERRL